MKFFIDMANPGEIRKAHEMDLLVLKSFWQTGREFQKIEKAALFRGPL